MDNSGRCAQLGSNGLCEKCSKDYKLVGYSCLPVSYIVYGCYIYDEKGYCDLCKNGYNLYDGYCLLPSQIQQVEQGIVTLNSIV